MKLLCKIGIHRPLKNHHHNFIDRVSGKTVYDAICPCGKRAWRVLGTKTGGIIKNPGS